MSDIDHICLTDDGKLKAVFSDHDILVLSPRGGMFAYVKAGQDVVRQHCAFVVSRYSDRLCAALSFRNMHLDSIVWVRALEKTQGDQKFTLGYPLSYVRWSSSKEAAETAGCLEVVSDGRISLKSEDETARLVLHPHGRRFAVCFPLLVGKSQDDNGSLTYHYVWQTQVFATADFPERWEYPLKLALMVVETPSEVGAVGTKATQGAHLRQISSFSLFLPELVAEQKDQALYSTQSHVPRQNVHASDNPSHTEERPAEPDGDILQQVTAIMVGPYASEAGNKGQEEAPQEESQEEPSPDIIQRTTHLPQASQPAFEDPNFLEQSSWWTDPTSQQGPMKEIVQIKWTSEVFMQFVPSLKEVHAWLTRDESFLATSDDGAFLKHQTAPKFESLYRSSALPVHAWSADGTGRYDFQPVGQAVLQLRQQSVSVLASRAVEAETAAAAAARVQQPVKSSEIKAKQTVRDLGVFTAFEDGRIRVRFADRTIVAVDRWHRFAEVVHRDGSTSTVSVTAPHGATEYVKAAMEFGNWVFKSDEEKDEFRAAKRAIEATVSANQRMALLCDYALTDKVPEAIARASVNGGSGRGSPADLTAFNTGLAAPNAHLGATGAPNSVSGLSTGNALSSGAVDAPASQQLDFAAAGRFGLAGDAAVSRSSVLHTPALKRPLQSHQAAHASIRSSMPAPIDPDPPTVLPTANFGIRESSMRASQGGFHGYSGDMDASLSFRQSGDSVLGSSFAKAHDQGSSTSTVHARGTPGVMGASNARSGNEAFGMEAGAPPYMGATRVEPSAYSRQSVPFSSHRGDGSGMHPLPGTAGRAMLGSMGGVGPLHARHAPGKATAARGTQGAYAGRLEELENEFYSSVKENVDLPAVSLNNGDRESVVEQWLKRNQDLLADLELDA